jgi:hypothetical protein
MELIVAILVAGPLGYLTTRPRTGVTVYLAIWAVVLPLQTVVVHSENADDLNWQYVVVQALVLALGLGLNRLGTALRHRRRVSTP